MSCVAGNVPSRMSRWTELVPIPRRSAASSMLIVSGEVAAGSNSAMPSRFRSSRTRTVVQVPPSSDLQRIRFIVTARSRSGQWPPSLRMTATGLGPVVVRGG